VLVLDRNEPERLVPAGLRFDTGFRSGFWPSPTRTGTRNEQLRLDVLLSKVPVKTLKPTLTRRRRGIQSRLGRSRDRTSGLQADWSWAPPNLSENGPWRQARIQSLNAATRGHPSEKELREDGNDILRRHRKTTPPMDQNYCNLSGGSSPARAGWPSGKDHR
jgi:hypothetical protein